MDAGHGPGPVSDPSFFGGRLLIEIEAWDGALHVGLASELTPQAYRFQGGLSYVRGFSIDGRLVAPQPQRAQSIRLHVLPFGPHVRFGPDHLDEVGQLHRHPRPSEKPDVTGTLLLPEDALAMAASCLGTVWRYVHIWTFDEEAGRASISAYSFSSTIHEDLNVGTAKD